MTQKADRRAELHEAWFGRQGRPEAAGAYMQAEDTLLVLQEDDSFMESYPLVEDERGASLYLYGSIMGDEELRFEQEFFESKAVGVSSISVARALSGFKGEELTVRINCRGGLTREGGAIASKIVELVKAGVKVRAVVEGVSASAALWPMIACGDITGFETSEYLVHRTWGMFIGNSTELREAADKMDKLDEQAFAAEGARVKGGSDKMRELADANSGQGTWLTSAEALEIELIDRIEKLDSRTEDADGEQVRVAVMPAARVMEEGDIEVKREAAEEFDHEGWLAAARFRLEQARI